MICKQCNEEFVEGAPFVSSQTGAECLNWAEAYGFCKPSCYVAWMTENKKWVMDTDVVLTPKSYGVLDRFLDIFKR